MIDLKGCRFDSGNIIYELMSEYFGRKTKPQLKEMSRYISKAINAAGPNANKEEIKKQIQAKVEESIKQVVSQSIEAFKFSLLGALELNLGNVSESFAEEIVNSTPLKEAIIEEVLKTVQPMEHGLNDKQWSFVGKVRKLLSYERQAGIREGQSEAQRILIEKLNITKDEISQHNQSADINLEAIKQDITK